MLLIFWEKMSRFQNCIQSNYRIGGSNMGNNSAVDFLGIEL
jgi:hypothetical protein